MVHYESEEVLPLPMADLWAFLQRHATDEIRTIHPEIQAQQVVSTGPNESVLQRTIDMRGKMVKSRWKVTLRPPTTMRWEILEGDGPWTVGSYLENTYRAEGSRTHLKTVAELKVVKVPFFLQKRIVAQVLDHISEQDLAQLKGRA